MSIEDKFRYNQDVIDDFILGWIGKKVAVTDPTSDTSVRGELVAYDGNRVFIKEASSNVIEGSDIMYFLNGAMSISLLDDISKNTSLLNGKVIRLCKNIIDSESIFMVDEDSMNDPWNEENLKGD